MKRPNHISSLLTALVLFIAGCSYDTLIPEEKASDLDLLGDYCGISHHNLNQIGEKYSVEIMGKDTFRLISASNLIYNFFFIVKGTSIFVPEQEFEWHNQSPGGSTWPETDTYKGSGIIYPEKNLITFKLDYQNYGDSYPLLLEISKYGDMNIIGNYQCDSICESVSVSEDISSDSLVVSVLMDYKDREDSSLIYFKVDGYECEKEIEIKLDSLTYLIGSAVYRDNYIHIDLRRVYDSQDSINVQTNYYTITGTKDD